jgi:hypothetical protein
LNSGYAFGGNLSGVANGLAGRQLPNNSFVLLEKLIAAQCCSLSASEHDPSFARESET